MKTTIEITQLNPEHASLETIRSCIKKRQMNINIKRAATAGKGRSQVFGWGGRRSAGYGEFKNNTKYPILYAALMQLATEFLPDDMEPLDRLAVQVNEDFECKPHHDTNNRGTSYMITTGDYTGGEICLEGFGEFNVCNRLIKFDGTAIKHWVKPITGKRISMVFFKSGSPVAYSGVPQVHSAAKNIVKKMHKHYEQLENNVTPEENVIVNVEFTKENDTISEPEPEEPEPEPEETEPEPPTSSEDMLIILKAVQMLMGVRHKPVSKSMSILQNIQE